jgi:hypothetical protein
MMVMMMMMIMMFSDIKFNARKKKFFLLPNRLSEKVFFSSLLSHLLMKFCFFFQKISVSFQLVQGKRERELKRSTQESK